MKLIFDNVRLLGYRHENNLLGENSSQINGKKIITLEGFILDLKNTYGGGDILRDVRTIQTGSKDFQPVFINGENFGQGKVKSFSVDPGNWVRTTQYQMEIEILQSLGKDNFNSFIPDVENANNNFSFSTYSQLKELNDKTFLTLIKSITENFNVDFDINNKVVSGTQSIELEIDTFTEIFTSDILASVAFLIATALLDTLPKQLSEAKYLNQKDIFRVKGEDSFDLINGIFVFNRQFSYKIDNLSNVDGISTDIIYSFQVDRDGIATVSERGVIKAETNYKIVNGKKQFVLTSSLTTEAFKNLSINARSRCLQFYNQYQENVLYYQNNTYHTLNEQPESRSCVIDKFNNQLEYEITFTNDQKQKNNYYLDYTLEVSKNENVWEAKEDGSLEGINAINYFRYNSALSAWNVSPGVKNQIDSRVKNFYNYITNLPSSDLKLINKNISKNEYLGKITYTYTYNDDNTILNGNDNIVRKIQTVNNDGHDGDPRLSTEFIVPNQPYVLRQDLGLDDLSTIDIQLQYQFKEEPGFGKFFNSVNYFNQIKNELNQRVNSVSARPKYIESVSFSSNENNQLELKAIYKYISEL